MFRRLTMAIFGLYMKYLLSSYTRQYRLYTVGRQELRWTRDLLCVMEVGRGGYMGYVLIHICISELIIEREQTTLEFNKYITFLNTISNGKHLQFLEIASRSFKHAHALQYMHFIQANEISNFKLCIWKRWAVTKMYPNFLAYVNELTGHDWATDNTKITQRADR